MKCCHSQAAGRSRRPLLPSSPCCVSSWGAETRQRRVSRCSDPFLPRFSSTTAPASQPARVWVSRTFSGQDFGSVALKLISFIGLHQCARALGMCCYASAAEDGEVSTASYHKTELGSPTAQGTAWVIATVHCVLPGLGQVAGSAGGRLHVFIPKQRGSASHAQTWRPRPALHRPAGLGAARHPLSSIKINRAARPVSKTHRCHRRMSNFCQVFISFVNGHLHQHCCLLLVRDDDDNDDDDEDDDDVPSPNF